MGFDTGSETGKYAPPPPDFSGGIKTYNEIVAKLGLDIKSKQAELDGINAQIVVANQNLQAAYTMKIASSEQTIADLLAKISTLETQHDQLVIDVNGKKIQRDNISLDFTAREKQLGDSWADFHKQSELVLVAQQQLKVDQDKLTADRAQLVADSADFQSQKTFQQAHIDQLTTAATDAMTQANGVLNDAKNKNDIVIAAEAQLAKDRQTLADKLAAAQPILAQADAVNAQAKKNAQDQANNSAVAKQNDSDAQEIKVMRIALQNQQLSLQAREDAVSLAEQKIGG